MRLLAFRLKNSNIVEVDENLLLENRRGLFFDRTYLNLLGIFLPHIHGGPSYYFKSSPTISLLIRLLSWLNDKMFAIVLDFAEC